MFSDTVHFLLRFYQMSYNTLQLRTGIVNLLILKLSNISKPIFPIPHGFYMVFVCLFFFFREGVGFFWFFWEEGGGVNGKRHLVLEIYFITLE